MEGEVGSLSKSDMGCKPIFKVAFSKRVVPKWKFLKFFKSDPLLHSKFKFAIHVILSCYAIFFITKLQCYPHSFFLSSLFVKKKAVWSISLLKKMAWNVIFFKIAFFKISCIEVIFFTFPIR